MLAHPLLTILPICFLTWPLIDLPRHDLYTTMRSLLTFAALAAVVAGKEMPKDKARAAELYDSGVMHERIMSEKFQQWDKHASLRASSAEEDEYPELHFAQCRDGKAVPFRDQKDFFFRCKNVNLHHFLPHSALGSETGQGSSSWGWTSEDGREFAIIAQADGAAFAEVRASDTRSGLRGVVQHKARG